MRLKLFSVVFALLSIFWSSKFAYGALVDIDVTPPILKQGTVFLVSVAGPERVISAKCSFNGEKISLFSTRVHGTVMGIGVVGVEMTPGEFPLVVKGVDCAGDVFDNRVVLKVEESLYEKINLKVPSAMAQPSKEQIVRIESESKLLMQLMDQITEKKFSGSFKNPVPGIVTSPFGTMRIFNGKVASFHTGTDFRGASGSPVLSIGAGRVALVKELYFAGNTVLIDHGLGIFSLYAHLLKTDVEQGDEIGRGSLVGRLGATGRVTAPHLHFGVKVRGKYVDSESLFALPMPLVEDAAPVAMVDGENNGELL
jgi:murein DD-endopeptidase MepM/ murein hydrolase activator NlpD